MKAISVSFCMTIGDGEDTPTDLTVSWTSDLDGEFSTEGSDSSGSILFTYSDFSVGTHTISSTVTDTDGLFAECALLLPGQRHPNSA